MTYKSSCLFCCILLFCSNGVGSYNDQSRLGKSCQSHAECQDQMICYQRFCEVAQPAGGMCTSAIHCRQSEACKNGICWKFAEKTCKDDRDCPNQTVCSRGLCRSGRDVDEICPRSRPLYRGNAPVECDPRSQRDPCPRDYYCDRSSRYCCEDDRADSYPYEEDYRNNLELGDRCTKSRYNPCKPRNSNCIRGICRCTTGYAEEDGECIRSKDPKRRKGLGKECSANDECYMPYSECRNRKCSCRIGFTPEEDSCKPQVYNCPYLTPLVMNGQLKECIVELSSNNQLRDDCPSGSFCVSYGSPNGEEKFSRGADVIGFCCPKIKSVCPVGQSRQCAAGDCQKHCPRDTHFCHKGGDRIWEEVCCEKPCIDGEFFDGTNCVPEKDRRSRF